MLMMIDTGRLKCDTRVKTYMHVVSIAKSCYQRSFVMSCNSRVDY